MDWVPNSPPSQHDPKEEPDSEKTQEISLNQLRANVSHNYKTLEQAVGTMFTFLTDELTRSEKDGHELRAVVAEKEEILRKAQEKAKSLEAAYLQLKEQLTASKNESKKKDEEIKELNEKGNQLKQKCEQKLNELQVQAQNWEASEKKLLGQLEEKKKQIDLLKKKVSDSETVIKGQKIEILDLKTSEIKLTGEMKNTKKKIQKVEQNFKNKCEEFSKLDLDFKTTKKDLECKIDESDMTIQDLESQQITLKLSLEEHQATISTQRIELEKKSKKVKDLKEQVKVLRQEQDDLPKKFGSVMSKLLNSTFPKKGRKRSASSSSSSSSEQEDENGKNCTVKEAAQQDVTPTATTGARKNPGRKRSTGKKRCEDVKYKPDTEEPQQHSLNEKCVTEDGTQMSKLEVSCSIPSSGRQLRKKSDVKP